jgi:hypothetical protein
MNFMTVKWNGTRKSNITLKLFVKYLFFFILGMYLIGKGFYKFLPFKIKSIIESSTAYDFGHYFGYLIGKTGGIVLGILVLKYAFEMYLEDKKLE